MTPEEFAARLEHKFLARLHVNTKIPLLSRLYDTFPDRRVRRRSGDRLYNLFEGELYTRLWEVRE